MLKYRVLIHVLEYILRNDIKERIKKPCSFPQGICCPPLASWKTLIILYSYIQNKCLVMEIVLLRRLVKGRLKEKQNEG